MERTKWIDRRFTFNIPPGWIYNIISRLENTPVVLKAIASELSEEQLQHPINNGWSIKLHIGHLADLESLHDGRIDDFIAGEEILRAADMSNAKTYSADHNHKPIEELLGSFSDLRRKFVTRLIDLEKDVQQRESLHPRLQMVMRPVDMAFFTAEHDDHHLATIRMSGSVRGVFS